MVDPYDWLGVPKGTRPPTHYQLLGLDPAVAEPAAVRAATDRQLRSLMPHLTGPDSLAAEQVWTELEEARDTLLDPDRRAHYDATVPLQSGALPLRPAQHSETTPPDISAFEELPPVSAPTGPLPWWQGAPDPAAGGADPWWKQPLPDEPAPPPPAPITATHAHAATLPLPIAPTHAQRRHPVAAPRRARRQTSKIVIVFVGLFVAGMIVGGMYYAFGRKNSTTTAKLDPTPEITKGDPKVKPIDNTPPKVEDPVIAAAPLPKNFADQLRPRTFTGHAGAVNWIAVERSGSRIATAGTDKTVRLWSVTKDAGLIRHSFLSPAVGIAWVSNDLRIVAADGFAVGLIDPAKTTPPRLLESPRGGVSVLAVNGDGRRALTGLTDGYLRLWDTDTGRFDEWPAAARGPVVAVDLTADGTRALAAIQDGPVSLWDVNARARTHEWNPHPGGAIAVQFSPDGKLAATAGVDGTASVYDLAGQKELCRLTGHTGPVTGIAWHAGGRQLVTVGVDQTARLWNAETGQPIRWTQALSGKGTCVAVDPGERFVVAGTSTGFVHLFPLPRVKGEVILGPLARPPTEPLPIPDTAPVALAIAAVRSELAKEFAYTRPDDVSILADNLRRRAAAERIPVPLRYGLLQESRTLAVKAGDPHTAFRAVEDLALWFDVDELAEKATTLGAIPPDADPVAVASAGLGAAERGETDARPEVVDRILSKLGEAAGLPPELGARLTALRQRGTAGAAERKAVQQALDVLKNAPEEQKSNQTVGLYLCLARQDWATGLPRLARGIDPRLVDAARSDIASPTDPKAQHRLGETWFAFAADSRDHRAKRAYLGRARVWFERAVKAKIDVTDSIKARARLDDIAKMDVPGKDPATLPLFAPVVVRRAYNTAGADVVAAEWRLDGGATARPDGVLFGPGNPAMHSKFGVAADGRLALNLRADGRELRLNLAGQEVAFAAAGKTLRVTVERKDDSVTLTAAGDEGETVTRTLDLPPVLRGPLPLSVRLTGTPTRPDGALLVSAIARGPVSLPPLTPE